MSEFARLILWAIDDADIPAKEIAFWAGVDDSTVRRWAGGSDPGFSHVQQLIRNATDNGFLSLLCRLVERPSEDTLDEVVGPLTRACESIQAAGCVLTRVEEALRDGAIDAEERNRILRDAYAARDKVNLIISSVGRAPVRRQAKRVLA